LIERYRKREERRTETERIKFVRELAEQARLETEEGELPILSRRFNNFSFIPGSSLLQPKECSVCLETYINTDTLIKLPCNHEFHRECAETWLLLNLNCPLCREIINPEPQLQNV
jgi:hypothetical protein